MGHAVMLPDDLYQRIQEYAKQSHQSPDAVITAWLTEAAQQATTTTEPEEIDLANDPLFQVAGMFASDDPGWVDRHDEYLAEEYANSHADEQ